MADVVRCLDMYAWRSNRGSMVAWLVAALVVGCANREPRPEMPSTPEPSSEQEAPATSPVPTEDGKAREPRAEGFSAGATEAGPPPPMLDMARPHATPSTVDSLRGLSPRFRTSLEDFMVAELALSSGTSACSDACRALRSMVRAASRMCAMASSEPEVARCEMAQERVEGAKEHVRRACHVCRDGPELGEK